MVQFLTDHYKLPPQLTATATKDEVTLLSELEKARSEVRHYQFNPGTSSEKFRLIAIGHSLGGLYTRNALGLLYKARFFHPLDGPLEPFVSTLFCKQNSQKFFDFPASLLSLIS